MLKFKTINALFIIFLIVFILLKIDNNISNWWLILFVFIWLVLTIIGSFHIRWNYFLKANHKNYQVDKNVIALTFDDGPNPEYTLKVLALLKKYNAKATFFCIGKNVESNPEILKEIVKEGHLIGNHSYNHQNSFGFLSTKKVMVELEKTKEIVKNTVNLEINFFRPPFGVTNPNIAKAVKKLDLNTFGWSVRPYDTVAKDVEITYQKIISKIKKGDVLLMHDSNELSVVVLEKVLTYFDENNFRTITLDKLFNLKSYE
ncbi:MAG: polysaccharide deacetylase family protein [Methanosarcinales archaeon]|nr:polysaccharide deacetylase family protein [Methanosarcinales archaeon]